jgi:hypothetical protein
VALLMDTIVGILAEPNKADAADGIILTLYAVIAVILLVALFIAGIRTAPLVENQRGWLDYGNFFIVAAGIVGVLVAWFAILQFPPSKQALGFLTALLGAIVGLVGTFFGVKQSADAREGAEKARNRTEERGLAGGGVVTTTPTITIEPPEDKKK